MRFYGAALMGATALLARSVASSSATTSGVSTFRSLRIGHTNREEDEERMVNMKSLPGAEKVSRSVSFSDAVPSQLLIATKKAPNTAEMTMSVHNTHFQTWLDSEVSPHIVFQYLMLDNQADNLFASPQFKTWMAYFSAFREEYPRAETVSIIDTLALYYSDEALVRIINFAKEAPDTRIRAAYFEKALFTTWVENKKTSAYISRVMGRQLTPSDAFKLLALDKAGDTIFTHSAFGTWLTFAKAFKRENPKLKTNPVIDTLTANLGDQVLAGLIKRAEEIPATKENAMYIKNALLDKWVTDGKVPAFVVKLLGTSSKDKAELLATYLEKIKSRPPFAAEPLLTRKRKRYANVVTQ